LFFWWDVLRAESDSLTLNSSSALNDNDSAAAGRRGQASLGPESLANLSTAASTAGTKRVLFEPRTIDILSKFWVFVILGGLFLYKMFTCDDAQRERVSDAELEAISLFFLMLSIGYFLVAHGLRHKLSLKVSISTSKLRFRITAISLCCVILFATKSILSLMYPVFNIKIKGTARDILYPWFFYTVPEIVPCFVLLTFLMKKKKSSVAMEDALLIAPIEHRNREEESLQIFRL
jgi:hypothetical protein